MQQVKDSPEIDTDLPVSRQMESNIYDYYGWIPYWGTGFYRGGYDDMGGTIAASPSRGTWRSEKNIAGTQGSDRDPHLRSIEAVTGYHIHATSGEIGDVEDFLVQDADWRIHYLVVDTKNWWVLISPRSARGIDCMGELVNLGVDRQRVKVSPADDASTLVDRTFERNFHNDYTDGRHNDRP